MSANKVNRTDHSSIIGLLSADVAHFEIAVPFWVEVLLELVSCLILLVVE